MKTHVMTVQGPPLSAGRLLDLLEDLFQTLNLPVSLHYTPGPGELRLFHRGLEVSADKIDRLLRGGKEGTRRRLMLEITGAQVKVA